MSQIYIIMFGIVLKKSVSSQFVNLFGYYPVMIHCMSKEVSKPPCELN